MLVCLSQNHETSTVVDFRGVIGRGGELGLVSMNASNYVDFDGILKEVVP